MRFTISRWMAATAVFCLNIALVKAYLFAEKEGENAELFDYIFLSLFALQLGLWRYLSTKGRQRRFWLGFQISGLAATFAMAIFSPASTEFNHWYTGAA